MELSVWLFLSCIDLPECFSNMIKAKLTPLENYYILLGLFLIVVLGLILSLIQRTVFLPALIVGENCLLRWCCVRWGMIRNKFSICFMRIMFFSCAKTRLFYNSFPVDYVVNCLLLTSKIKKVRLLSNLIDVFLRVTFD